WKAAQARLAQAPVSRVPSRAAALAWLVPVPGLPEGWMASPPVLAVAVRAAPYERRVARSSGRLGTVAEPAVPARAGRHVAVPDGRNPVGREAGLERPPAGSPARPAPALPAAGSEDGPEERPAGLPARP